MKNRFIPGRMCDVQYEFSDHGHSIVRAARQRALTDRRDKTGATLEIVAVAGPGAPTPSAYAPIKARAHAGSMRKKAETRLEISQKKVLELGG